MSTVAVGVEGCAEVGPEWVVDGGEVKVHLGEVFCGVSIRLEFQITHLAQPKVHSLSSQLSTFMK